MTTQIFHGVPINTDMLGSVATDQAGAPCRIRIVPNQHLPFDLQRRRNGEFIINISTLVKSQMFDYVFFMGVAAVKTFFDDDIEALEPTALALRTGYEKTDGSILKNATS